MIAMFGTFVLLTSAHVAFGTFETFHHEEFHHDNNTKYMYPDIRTFMKEYQIDVKPVRDIMHVVFSRLWPRDPRFRSEHADTLYEIIMAKSNIPVSIGFNDSTSVSVTFNDSIHQSFLFFCENLLTVTIAYHWCGITHESLAECIDRRLSETCTHSDCAEHRISDKNVFMRVKCLYSRMVQLKGLDSSTSLQYVVEAYANRMLCVNEKLLRSVINPGTLPEDEKRRLTFAAIVVFIVVGYNFVDNEEVCTGSFIADLYNHYGHDGKMSVTQLEQLFYELRHNSSVALPSLQHGNENYNGYYHESENEHHNPFFLRSVPNELPAEVQKADPSPTHILMKAMQASNVRSGGEYTDHETLAKDQGRRDWNGVRNDHGREEHEQSCWRHWNISMDNQFFSLKANSTFVTRTLENRCHSVEKLLEFYMGRWVRGQNIPTSVFLDMCPALLHQALLGNCDRQHNHPHPFTQLPPTTTSTTVTTPNAVNGSFNATVETLETISKLKGYLYGSLSVLVISLCSVFGAVFMKVSRTDVKTLLMGSMLALAVGCLVSDAALHLLPEVIMPGEAENDDDILLPDHLQKLCAFLLSVYAFFLMEMLLSLRHSHSHSHSHHVDDHVIDEISMKYVKEGNEIKEINFMKNKLTETPGDASPKSMNNKLPKQMNLDLSSDSPTSSVRSDQGASSGAASPPDNSIQILESRCSNASDRLSSHDPKSGIKALAWMIIIGDGIHNFADGLAIGAAFSITFAKGISTSLTVLCHEIPHELGDFAVLITSGLSIKKAMALNFLSSLSAFAGLYLGLVLGDQQEASRWIFAVGAGMFLYVALTDLVPECKEYFRQNPTAAMFLGQNFGVILGFVFMLVLAMYEDKLEIKA